MPVPIRDDGSPGPTRRLIVLVHGFNSSAETWARLKRLLSEDPQITGSFDVECFDYTTGLGYVPVIQRLPTVEETGEDLAIFLDRKLRRNDGNDQYIDATLVGHSMGGLVIQSCLKYLLNKSRGRDLNRIRQVILFATPNFGSSVVSGIRRLVARVFSNPQELALRMFSAESRSIHEGIRDQIIFAKRRLDTEYPLPFHCFWGKSDAIVLPVSAQGHFPSGAPLTGDHFEVHSPPNAVDQRYAAFVDALLHPHGHPNVWEVERFLFSVKVWPLAPGTEIAAKHGDKQRKVICDNAGKVIRQTTFGENNLCRDPYVLKYGTRSGGWLVPQISQPHCTPADKLRLYDDNGCDAYYEVEPTPGSTSTLSLTVYKGFDAGHRDFHMHLGKSTYFRRLCVEIDLTEYVRTGWRVTPPRLYFHPTDPGDHVLCGQRDMLAPDPAHAVDPAGIWKWELEFVKEGVVDFVFNVERTTRRRRSGADAFATPGRTCPAGLRIAAFHRQPGAHAGADLFRPVLRVRGERVAQVLGRGHAQRDIRVPRPGERGVGDPGEDLLLEYPAGRGLPY